MLSRGKLDKDHESCNFILQLEKISYSCSFFCNSLTDKAYKNIASLANLRFLDLCGAQVFAMLLVCFDLDYSIMYYADNEFPLVRTCLMKAFPV